MPYFEVIEQWKNPIEEYNQDEYEKLLQSGMLTDSQEYREEYHKEWILKMYQIFGFDASKRMLDNIPLLKENEIQILKEQENAFWQVFERKYELTGEIALSSKLLQQIQHQLPRKEAFALFRELNKNLETGENNNLAGLLSKAGIKLSETELQKLIKNVERPFQQQKFEKIKDILNESIQQYVTYQQGRIHDLIQKIVRENLQDGKAFTAEDLISVVKGELRSQGENGEWNYSIVIQRQEQNIEHAIQDFMENQQTQMVLNDSILQMLKRSKEQIGNQWIRKLLATPQKMNQEEYKEVCVMLGIGDLQHDEEIQMKEQSAEAKEKAMKLLQEIGYPEVFNFEKMETLFGGVSEPYSKQFGKFFLEHKQEIMSNPEYMQNFSKMHNGFNNLLRNSNVRTAYEQGRLQVATVLREILNVQYEHKEGEDELAKLASEAQLEAHLFEYAQKQFEITRQREESTIPSVKAIGKKYRGRMLRVDDPLILFVGDITNCCQRFGDVGEGTMQHAATERNGRIFLIEEINNEGKVVQTVAQSWVWRNNDIMCFDNIEVKRDQLSHDEQEEVLDIYQRAGEQAIQIDMKTLKDMLKKGKITQETYENYVLKEVRVGLGYNAGMPILTEKSTQGKLEKSYDVVKPKEAEKRYFTGEGEHTPWIDSEYSVIIAKNDEVKRKEHSLEREVPVSYRNQREIITQQGTGISQDTLDEIRKLEAITYRSEQQIMQDCSDVEELADIYGCEPESIQINLSRDKDWYSIHYETDESIYVADIALVNGMNAQKNETRNIDLMSASLELLQKMYEIMLEADEKGKTVTCDATRDTSGLNLDNMVKKGLITIEQEEDYDWGHSDIEMRRMTIKPNAEKLKKELTQLEKLLERAEDRRRVYKRKEADSVGGEDR